MNDHPSREHVTRRRFIQYGLAGSALAAAPGLLAACGDGGGSSGAAAGDGGATVRAAFAGSEKDTLYPIAPVTDVDIDRKRHLFDTLGYTDERGVVLQLAESIEPNRDGSVWTVRLRDDVRFHDGSPLGARDVEHTFARVLDPRTASIYTSELMGVDPDKLDVVDRLTLRIGMTEPVGDMREQLCLGGIGIVKQGADPKADPIGSGPFRFEAFAPGQSSRLARFDDYWQPGVPRLSALELLSINDPEARANALRGGQADYVTNLSPAAAKTFEGNAEYAIFRGPPMSANEAGFFMNQLTPPFDDARVRLACKLACDREALIRGALLGFGELGNDNVGLGQPLYDDELPQREHDPEQARSLIRAAGAQGAKVTLTAVPSGAGAVESAALYAEQLGAVGLDVSVKKVDPGSFFTGWRNRSRSFQLVSLVSAGGPIISWFGLTLLPDSPFNLTSWYEPGFARRYDEARATLDAAKRREIMFALQRQLWEDGGQIVWSHVAPIDVHRASVRGVQTAGLDSYPVFWKATNGVG